MGLQATIEKGVAAAFVAAGDLVTSLPLQAPGTFDEVTETETPGATGAINVIQLSQADAEQYFIGFSATATQAIDVALMAEAASATLAPEVGHQATWQGAIYQVHSIDNSHPALLMLGLRRPK